MTKIRSTYIGYNQHDSESIFKCPSCGRESGGWTFAQYDDEIHCKCGAWLTLKEISND